MGSQHRKSLFASRSSRHSCLGWNKDPGSRWHSTIVLALKDSGTSQQQKNSQLRSWIPNKFEDGITVGVDVVFFQLQHFPVTTTDLFQPRPGVFQLFSSPYNRPLPTKKVKAVGWLFPKTCAFSRGVFGGAKWRRTASPICWELRIGEAAWRCLDLFLLNSRVEQAGNFHWLVVERKRYPENWKMEFVAHDEILGGFKYFFMFIPIRGNDPIWLYNIFRSVETTN